MMNEPVELLLVEDNEDDIVLIEEAFAEVNARDVQGAGRRRGVGLFTARRAIQTYTEARIGAPGYQYAEEERL